MKCPDCKKEGAQYVEKRPDRARGLKKIYKERDNFEATHNCGWRGLV